MSEDLIEFDYLKKLHERHDEWMLNDHNSTPTLVIDGNQNILIDQNARYEILDKIKSFVDSRALAQ